MIGGFVSYELNITQNLTNEGTFLNQAGGILECYIRKTHNHSYIWRLKDRHHEVFILDLIRDESYFNLETANFITTMKN